MMIICNGQPVEVEAEGELTVLAFLALRGFKADRVAVEQNGTILPRGEWERSVLNEGDRLEVVHFVGGG